MCRMSLKDATDKKSRARAQRGLNLLLLVTVLITMFTQNTVTQIHILQMTQICNKIPGEYATEAIKKLQHFGIVNSLFTLLCLVLVLVFTNIVINGQYKQLVKESDLEQENLKAQLHALRAQVNPHFAFNVLSSIRLHCVAKGEDETAEQLMNLTKLIRNLIDWKEEKVPLEEELTFLGYYFELEQYRYEDEFQYEIDADEAAMACMLPKMTLQPLAENACVHWNGTDSVRRIKVTAGLSDNNSTLKLQISDNGGGFSEEKLEEIRAMIKGETQPDRVGLVNIYKRLFLYYDGRLEFDLHNNDIGGTTCEIRIPYTT